MHQLIDQNIENFFHLKVLVKALFQRNCLKSVISLISSKSVVSVKSINFGHFGNI